MLRTAAVRWHLPRMWRPFLILLLSCAPVRGEAVEPVGERRGLVLRDPSPLAEKTRFLERVLMPTTADRLSRFEQVSGQQVSPLSLDTGEERADAWVPAHKPPGGYGVIVFVSPTPEWPVPRAYRKTLDAHGIIWIAARRSGNRESVYDRRMPLALHALEWVERRFPVNPDRRYIAGFSGGGRVAQRIALAWPDVFSGALLIAGSDPFGENGTVLPTRDRFARFQQHTRIVFATGMQDTPNRTHDKRTRDTMQAYCVAHLFRHLQSRTEHWIPDGRGFARAVRDLDTPRAPPADQIACQEALLARIDAAVAEIRELADTGHRQDAGERLAEIERLYGGLAAPESVRLARALAQ